MANIFAFDADNNEISTDRVQGGSKVIEDVFLCPICHNILRNPVSCKTCENSFCSNCIHLWLFARNICPFNCQYEERKCPPLMKTLLSKLNINCRYKKNGCSAVVGYDALEKHEASCPYEMQQCQGCNNPVLRKDLALHEQQCDLISETCAECQMMSTRKDMENHTETTCLKNRVFVLEERMNEQREMFIQALEEQQNLINELTQKFAKLMPVESLTPVSIIPAMHDQPVLNKSK
ncbi:unnamed protein product [Didymodactylos carnosus]|uniref:Uncharacterized protein n=1 Tax=Didymodactylos carnosus TaxID=1234261 RepID=A0A814H6U0_9BILA|nr:unnamed protein product [Didymodactylos carnosus]CAF1005705.1 unnamed protein product [Didymodactylos carnosus]CAF3744796.1 unnamed protein product [Didymodactylos carnosus]CAF3777038.1 unnamed protein product [Didymodactylos carnosus]